MTWSMGFSRIEIMRKLIALIDLSDVSSVKRKFIYSLDGLKLGESKLW